MMQAFETTLPARMPEVEAAVRAALQDQGFGILTEIDVAATLRTKLGVEREPLKILGACNPHFAHQALAIDPAVSLVLPCNVVIEASEGGTHVAIVDPRALMSDPTFEALAGEAAAKLEAVIATLDASFTAEPAKGSRE